METSQANRYITPTLQANFNYAIGEILERMNTMDIFSVWKAIRTLYRILPPTVHKEVTDDYERIAKQLEEAGLDNGIDTFMSAVHLNNVVNDILEKEASPFFRTMYELLYKGGYLEKTARLVETNAPAELLDS